MKIAAFRKAHFNAAHRLHNPDWSDEQNIKMFGLCNNPYYHGHNYDLEVKIVGEIDIWKSSSYQSIFQFMGIAYSDWVIIQVRFPTFPCFKKFSPVNL